MLFWFILLVGCWTKVVESNLRPLRSCMGVVRVRSSWPAEFLGRLQCAALSFWTFRVVVYNIQVCLQRFFSAFYLHVFCWCYFMGKKNIRMLFIGDSLCLRIESCRISLWFRIPLSAYDRCAFVLSSGTARGVAALFVPLITLIRMRTREEKIYISPRRGVKL